MTNMSLDSSNDGGEVPTASLQEILDNDENIHKSARLSRKDRNSIRRQDYNCSRHQQGKSSQSC